MKNIVKSKLFWTILILATAIIFIVLINVERVYKSEADILIIPRSETTVRNINQIIGNLETISYSLSFYDRMIRDNKDVLNDRVAELPAIERKNYWDSKIEINHLKNTGILRIIASDKSPYQASVLNNQAVKDLVAVSSLYYNIKTDIDVRIIDGPIGKYTTSQSYLVVLIESLAGGIVIAILIFLLSAKLFWKKEDRRNFSSINFPSYEKSLFDLKGATHKKSLQKLIEDKPEIYSNEISQSTLLDTSLASSKEAAAPANLPIASDNFFENNSKEEKVLPEKMVINNKFAKNLNTEKAENKKIKSINNNQESIIREATPEEVKERLNKLLSGKL